MYSFSPTYPVKDGTCSPTRTGMLRSFTIHISHPSLRYRSLGLAENMKNPFRKLFNVPSDPRCPPRSIWWQRLRTSLIIEFGMQILPTSLDWCWLADLVYISTPSLILNTEGSNIDWAARTSFIFPSVSTLLGNSPFLTQLITSLQTLSLAYSSAISLRFRWTCWI